ncbi:MAG: hypothetical protein ACYC09_01330 [Bacteroidota bacterium]
MYRLPAAGTADLRVGGFNVGPDGSPANNALANRSLQANGSLHETMSSRGTPKACRGDLSLIEIFS